MPYSAVPRAELNQDGTINLIVNVKGFEPGEPVELSGQATQENGAVATFYSVQEMPQNGPLVVPRLSPIPAKKFVAGFPITIVARAAQVWITTLANEPDSEAARSNVISGQSSQAAWKEGDAQWAVSPLGQESPSTLLHHGTWWDRVKGDPLDAVMGGRFTRLFPHLPGARFEQADLELLAKAMTAPPEDDSAQETGPDPEENPGIPAAYTYLGQFVDHDLTFDPISHLRESLTNSQLQALVDFRTPRFDLDNLYGRGPDDQPYLYEEDGVHLLLGEPMPGNPFDPGAAQLPRGPNGRALIGDPRNDENRIVAQLHAIFLRFHNRVVDKLGGKKHADFPEARRQVRWHYQWILVNEFLRVILQEQTYKSAFPNPYSPVPTIPRLRQHGLELMPVEFSVAAYRFGHSMVRPRYRLNPAVERPIFSSTPGDDLGGFRPIPAGWAIDWPLFIDLGHDAGQAAPQLSYKIDTSLVNPLGKLPAQVAKHPSSLALRNLMRGMEFRLPSGQAMAEALGVPPLADEDLVIGKATADGPRKPITEVAPGFAGNAPLWAYVLSEAQVTSWKDACPGRPGMTFPSGSDRWEAGASPRSSPPCSWATPRPTSTPSPRSSRSRTSRATGRSDSPS